MKMRGSWAWVVKFAGVTVLVSGLLLVTAFLDSGKRSPQTDVKSSGTAASGASRLTGGNGDPRWMAAYGKLPLSFEENQGQTAREVRYVSHGSGYELFLTPEEAVLALRPNAPRDLSPLHRTAYIGDLRNARRVFDATVSYASSSTAWSYRNARRRRSSRRSTPWTSVRAIG